MSSRGLWWVAAAVLGAFAALALVPAVGSLVGADPQVGGVDLQSRLHEVQLMWSRTSPYSDRSTASVYPPATYVLLGPIALMSYSTLKWAWAISALVLLAWLGGALGRQGPRELAPVAWVLPFAFSGVAYGLQNGQLHVHATTAALLGSLLLIQRQGTRRTDLGGAALLLLGLVKPTVTGPFVLLLLALPGRRRPLLLVVVGYVVATGLGLLLIGEGVQPLVVWFSDASVAVSYGAPGSYGNLHAWSEWLGLDRANTALSLVALGGLGVWALSLKPDDDLDGLWIRLGIVAVFARMFTYHQDYDDALLLVTLGGLLTVCRRRPGTVAHAALALILAMGVLHLPGREWLGLDEPGPGVLGALRVLAWTAAAALLWRAQRSGPRYGLPRSAVRGGEGD